MSQRKPGELSRANLPLCRTGGEWRMIRFLLLLLAAIALSSCADDPPQTASGKKLKLETVDRGPMQPKTYVYREVNE